MSQETLPEFGISKNIKQVGRTDLPGGGLVTVENGYAYVGHIDPPYGISIVDVHDPKHPKLVCAARSAGGNFIQSERSGLLRS
jgi:hypothetical protein